MPNIKYIRAFFDALTEEYNSMTPTVEEEHIFSDEFENKMQHLISRFGGLNDNKISNAGMYIYENTFEFWEFSVIFEQCENEYIAILNNDISVGFNQYVKSEFNVTQNTEGDDITIINITGEEAIFHIYICFGDYTT